MTEAVQGVNAPNVSWAFKPNITQMTRDARSSQTTDLSSAQIIYKVAQGSPAQELGLVPGDCLLAFNGLPIKTSLTGALLGAENGTKFDARYMFYQPAKNTFMEVETDCMPLGLSLLPNSHAIIETYQTQGYYGNEGFFALWEREDYVGLREAVSAAAHQSASLSAKPLSFMKRLVISTETKPPLEAMRIICNFEMDGDVEQLREFLHNMTISDFTPDMQALLYFYAAHQAQADQNVALYQELICAAYKFYPMSERIKRETLATGLDINGQEDMLGKLMPLHYKFDYLNGGAGAIDLPTILATMPMDKILPICFMPMSRGSDAYNEALKVFHSIYPYHKARLHQMLVVTNMQKLRKDPASWYEQEDMLIAAGYPLSVVLEPTGNFCKDLSLRNAPTLWAIDKSGRIVWDKGLLSDFDYWEML